MAKGTAICKCATCGATFKVEAIKYNRAEADSWVSYAERTYDECTECYKKRKAAERKAANAEAADRAKEQGLPALTGSPKQIAWAETLRMATLDKIAEYSEKDGGGEEWASFTLWIKSEYTDAKYWIDHRGENVYEFLRREIPIYQGAKT